jgi:galactosyl transferase GMA12/MNN10 family
VKISIVSGTPEPRLDSAANHRVYADRHGYAYRVDLGPYPLVPRVHYFKLCAVERALPESDWVFWLDDDAFFTDLDRTLESVIEGLDPAVVVALCAGPVNPRGQTTFLNAGVFFIRNCPDAFVFLDLVKRVPLERVKAWWDERTLGMYTGSDQEAITYLAHTEQWRSRIRVLPYDAFNNRPDHYERNADEHFVVHFPGVPDKRAAIADFGRRYGLHETTLLPPEQR